VIIRCPPRGFSQHPTFECVVVQSQSLRDGTDSVDSRQRDYASPEPFRNGLAVGACFAPELQLSARLLNSANE
jgi:hypothetical protein